MSAHKPPFGRQAGWVAAFAGTSGKSKVAADRSPFRQSLPPRGAVIEINAIAPIAARCVPAVGSHAMKPSGVDPAEQGGYLRFLYRDWRPTRLARIWNGAFAWLSGVGLTPEILLTLQTRSPDSGRLVSTVLAVADVQGERHLVSMLGDGSQWVRNVRAADGEAFVKRGRSRPVRLVELPAQGRAPILKAWCQIATSGRRHLPVPHDAPLSAFEKIAADYPVFRIDPRR